MMRCVSRGEALCSRMWDDAARKRIMDAAALRHPIARHLGLVLGGAALIVSTAPPNDFWPFALLGWVPLVLLAAEANAGRAALLGWIQGVVAEGFVLASVRASPRGGSIARALMGALRPPRRIRRSSLWRRCLPHGLRLLEWLAPSSGLSRIARHRGVSVPDVLSIGLVAVRPPDSVAPSDGGARRAAHRDALDRRRQRRAGLGLARTLVRSLWANARRAGSAGADAGSGYCPRCQRPLANGAPTPLQLGRARRPRRHRSRNL